MKSRLGWFNWRGAGAGAGTNGYRGTGYGLASARSARRRDGISQSYLRGSEIAPVGIGGCGRKIYCAMVAGGIQFLAIRTVGVATHRRPKTDTAIAPECRVGLAAR